MSLWLARTCAEPEFVFTLGAQPRVNWAVCSCTIVILSYVFSRTSTAFTHAQEFVSLQFSVGKFCIVHFIHPNVVPIRVLANLLDRTAIYITILNHNGC